MQKFDYKGHFNMDLTSSCQGIDRQGLDMLRSQGSHEDRCSLRSVIVLTGPTAVGKGTIEAVLKKMHPHVWISLSATTRAPRPGEQNGVDYLFVSDEEFDKMEAEGKFLETAVVHGMAKYGTLYEPVKRHVDANIPTLIEIDIQGARTIKKRADELGLRVHSIFIAPPTFEDLQERLKKRGTENEEQQSKRLKTAHYELETEDEFDTVIVNDSVEEAEEKLWNIIKEEYGLEDNEN